MEASLFMIWMCSIFMCTYRGKKKYCGIYGGMLLGIFLGLIGVIVVECIDNKPVPINSDLQILQNSTIDELLKIKEKISLIENELKK